MSAMGMPAGHGPLPFAETFAKARRLLGDETPAIRVGALYTLDALGEHEPGGRQAIVDVICGYLRAAPEAGDVAARAVAQRVLADRLRPNQGAYWSGVGVDLSHATLADFDMSGCRFDAGLRMDHALFVGQARFRGVMVRAGASFTGARFCDHAWFERTSFIGPAHLRGVTFDGDAWFGETTFTDSATFAGATFGGHAWFAGATFHGPVHFEQAVFRRSVGFRGAVAHGDVGLSGTTFLGPARVSRRDEHWNISAPGWRVVVDPDNEAVGQLLWVGHPELVSGSTP
jgi:uncharacterized protein YjbI with pentapeptide repeats